MKKIIFLSILGMLMMQGCNTAPATSKNAAATMAAPAAPMAAPAVEVKKEKAIEMDPLKIMTDSNMGNCTSCHAIPAKPEVVAGDMGPPYVGMKHRFPDIEMLKAAIYDQRAISPQTVMPPFGRNKVLTPEQIDAIAHYIYQF